jgi:PAS domain S-box-containing protein
MGKESGKPATDKEMHARLSKSTDFETQEELNPFQILFETMSQGAVYQNADGKIIRANSAAERILGLTLDQMLGRESIDPRWKATRVDGSNFPGDEHPAMVSLRTGKPVKDVIMGVFNPFRGERRWINVNAVPLFKHGQRRPYQVYTTFSDVTKRVNAEENLLLYTHLLQHDLRNDLHVMLAHVETAEMLGVENEIISNMLHTIKAAGTRMNHLLNAMDPEYELKETRIITMIQEVASNNEKVHQGLKVIVQSDSDVESISIPSHRLLANVFHNLIRNAAQYCGDNPVVTVHVANTEDLVSIRVSDNGPGIPESVSSNLFKKGASTNGGGFGLYLCREILTTYGGTIRLGESGPDEGAVFLIELPLPS